MKMKKIIKKRFSKKEKNFDTMMFEIVDVKNSNTKIFIKYYIDDTTTISNSFTKFSFKFEKILKEKSAAQTHEKEQKKELEKNKNESFEKKMKKKTDDQISFLYLTFI